MAPALATSRTDSGRSKMGVDIAWEQVARRKLRYTQKLDLGALQCYRRTLSVMVVVFAAIVNRFVAEQTRRDEWVEDFAISVPSYLGRARSHQVLELVHGARMYSR